MSIPYGRKYTTTATAAVIKRVTCERCQAAYGYRMERQASGSGTSLLFLDNRGASKQASKEAARKLMRLFAEECDPVPCPECGWYQAHMVPEAKRLHRRRVFVGGAILLVAMVLLVCLKVIITTDPANRFPGWADQALLPAAVACGLAGLALLIAKGVINLRFDPNRTDIAWRLELARARSFRIADPETPAGGGDGLVRPAPTPGGPL